MRENADEDFALTFQETRDSNTASFDLVVFDPTTIQSLETKVTKVQLVSASGNTTAIAALGFTILYSTGKKGHGSNFC
jgi:hypothetical protein